MKRHAIVGISVVVVIVLGATLQFSNQFRLAVLTPAELGFKRISPPTPPDDSCAEAQRALADFAREEPVRETNPLSADEVAIYKALLQRWNSNSNTVLKVSDRTSPLDRELSDCECLKRIDVHSLANASHSFHVLTRNVLTGKATRLVDAGAQATIVQTNDPSDYIRKGSPVNAAVEEAVANGLFEMSEIAFDREHRRALVSYSFVCGSLCGNGGVWLFEKVDGVWNKSKHSCGGWMS